MKRSKSLPSPWYRQDKHGKPILHKMDPLEDELCRAVLLYKTDSSSVYERHELLSQCNQIVSLGIQEEINQLITLLQQLGILWPDLDILEILDRLEAGAVQLKHLSVSLGSSSYSLGEMRQEHRSCHLVDLIVRYLGTLNNLGEELKKEKESVRKLVKRHNLELETEEWREEEDPDLLRKHSHRYSIGEDLKRDRSRKVSDVPSSSEHGRFSLDYTALQLQQREHRISRDHNRRSFDQYGRPIRHSIDHSAGRPHLQHDPKPRRTSETRLEYSRLDKRSVDNTNTSNRTETSHNRTRWSIFETIRERSDLDIVPDPVAGKLKFDFHIFFFYQRVNKHTLRTSEVEKVIGSLQGI